MTRPSYIPDNFTLALIGVVTLASVLPARGAAAPFFEGLTAMAIGLLFFMHGAKLSRQAIVAGIMHWRLHLLVFAATFIMFPVFGLGLRPLLAPLVTPELYTGVLFLCVLPATVQSAIAFTSMGRGNIPAAICSASCSTLVGVFVTPLLVHVLRPWIGEWIRRRASVLKFVDQGSILLVVFTAFSAAVIEGLWRHVPLSALAGLLVLCAILLGLALSSTVWAARRMGFSKADEITIVFCGSKKSMVSGIPMAKVLFASSAVGAIVLPLMIFHQMQLMVCAVLAQRYARRQAEDATVKSPEAATTAAKP